MIPRLLCWLLAVLPLADGFVSPLKVSCKRQSNLGLRMAADEDESYLSWLTHKVDRARRPKFVSIARARLQKDFAVLLMRSSYQVKSANEHVIVW